MRRPSPSLVIACIALAGAWGGPAVAQSLLTGASIQNNSLTTSDIRDRTLRGRDVHSNTITGRNVAGLSGRDIIKNGLDGSDIDEGTFEIVPRAARALRADAAGTADAVKGSRIVRLAYAQPVGPDTTVLLDEGGLRVAARCSGSGTLSAHAVPTVDGGLVRVSTVHPAADGTITTLQRSNDFRSGDQVNLVAGGTLNATGTLTYWSPAGDVITLDYLADDGFSVARGFQCVLAGTAVHAQP